ncbi:hypothetical protein [Actinomadura sp. HBU206391]|uniref:hypothetical protein n=1 Tax=Actinomadura sp. HBU206391 TaxID=2731692 RepID=UPI00164F3463|nr:hypothetical protein [Actinomadura sp. HBU206391]MBC6457906.1 hypothetical protein [Actinomadura sp. HBU206391]
MNTVEEQLREALQSRATTFTSDPAAIALVRRRIRRDRRRLGIGVLVPVAAAAAAVVPAVTLIQGAPESGGGVMAGTRSTEKPNPMHSEMPIKPEEYLQAFRPTSEVGILKPADGGYGVNQRVWFSTMHNKPAFCIQELDSSGAVRSGGCNNFRGPNKTSMMVGIRTIDGGKPIMLTFGYTDNRVVSVTAELAGGSQLPGSLLRGRGFPRQAWQVGTPRKEVLKSIVFRDRQGTVLNRIRPPESFDPRG